MSQSTFAARCESCSKTYRVPSPERAYKCKACGARLVVEAPSANPDVELGAARECPRCHALSFEATAHCVECGAALNPTSTGRSHAERVGRREASVEFARAAKLLKLLRFLFWLGFAGNLLGVGLSSIALLDPQVEPGPGFLAVAVCAIGAALNLAGALLIGHQPLLWSLLNAGLATLSAAVRLLEAYADEQSRVVVTVSAVVSFGWLMLMWWIVFAAAKVQTLRRRHPDLYAAHLLSGTPVAHRRSSSASESGAERAARMQDHARRRAVRFALLASGLVLALSVLVSGGVYVGMRPAPLDETSAAFCAAWNARNVDAIAEMCSKQDRETVRRRLARLAVVRGWAAAWPAIDDDEGETALPGIEGGLTRYRLSNGETLAVRWRLTASRWQIEDLTLPGPSVQPRIAEFVAAWQSGESSRVLELYHETDREERARGMERLLERLGWPQAREPLTLRHAEMIRADRAEVTFALDSGRTLDARFELDDDFVWWLGGLRTTSR